MSGKRKYEAMDEELAPPGGPEDAAQSVRTLRRSISPPPLKRKVFEASIDLATGAATPGQFLPSRRFPRIFDKEKRKAIYLNISEEKALELPASDDLELKIAEVAREQAKNLKPDSGGMVVVDYVHPDFQMVRGENGQLIKRRNPDAGETRDDEKAPVTPFEGDASPTGTMCTRCQKIVKKSTVINRPWRKVVDLRKEGPVWVSIEDKIEYHGKKCEVFGHYAFLGELRKSAQAGCHLCSLLDAFNPAEPILYDESSRIPYVIKVIYAENHDEGPGVMVLQANGYPTKATHLMFDEARQKIKGTLAETRTDAEPVISLARQWLKTCLDNHENCRARSAGTGGLLPTRLLRVQASEKAITSVRLVLGSSLAPATPYVCLSHCWGGADIIKLKTETLDEFQREIPPSELPKNFEDAIIITGLLGYEYVWIDSLCIIQDSDDDWKHEAARMGSVYRNAVCIIAALGSANSHGGCFTTRSTLSFTPCQLLPKTESRPGVYAENWYKPVQPLHTRGWVLQERCLSIRTLNFGSNMVSWDCISSKASEKEPEMECTSYDASLKKTFDDLLARPATDTTNRRTDWIGAWWKLVREYSSCNLTFPSNKWPAMEGLATEVQKDRELSLVHGLWEFNFIDELLWTISRPKKRRLDIGIPSWSWLSIDGKINRRRYDYSSTFRLDARARVVRSADLTIPISGDEIHVTGRMNSLRWAIRKVTKGSTPAYDFTLPQEGDKPKGKPTCYGRWTPDTIADQNWETWSLQLVKADAQELKGSVGLVVVPVQGKLNVWKRVGFYECNWRDESHRDRTVPKRWFGDVKSIRLI